jgi:hypothetical protein
MAAAGHSSPAPRFAPLWRKGSITVAKGKKDKKDKKGKKGK